MPPLPTLVWLALPNTVSVALNVVLSAEAKNDPETWASTLMPPELTTWAPPLTTVDPLAMPLARTVSSDAEPGPTPEPAKIPETTALTLRPPELTTWAPPLIM